MCSNTPVLAFFLFCFAHLLICVSLFFRRLQRTVNKIPRAMGPGRRYKQKKGNEKRRKKKKEREGEREMQKKMKGMEERLMSRLE